MRAAAAKQPPAKRLTAKVAPSRVGLVQSGVYLTPAVHRALAKLAIDLGKSRQAVVAGAVVAVLKAHGVMVEPD